MKFLFKNPIMDFSGECFTWFQSYLCERIFFMGIENKLSDYGRILLDVPQGSIVGSLLFLVYVNYIVNAFGLPISYNIIKKF